MCPKCHNTARQQMPEDRDLLCLICGHVEYVQLVPPPPIHTLARQGRDLNILPYTPRLHRTGRARQGLCSFCPTQAQRAAAFSISQMTIGKGGRSYAQRYAVCDTHIKGFRAEGAVRGD